VRDSTDPGGEVFFLPSVFFSSSHSSDARHFLQVEEETEHEKEGTRRAKKKRVQVSMSSYVDRNDLQCAKISENHFCEATFGEKLRYFSLRLFLVVFQVRMHVCVCFIKYTVDYVRGKTSSRYRRRRCFFSSSSFFVPSRDNKLRDRIE
jgi:hypothetical protein